ncbi:hypothetical protein [Stenotrophomonas sp.]|uniref:hypothetical protein n=1 Tax=Stenotrophomonas sp. TaxID=69392 RepID=UPI0028A9FAF1|nr:hypothetical protein [Stenotrophomonas sp.]
MKALADTIDAWVDAGLAFVTETAAIAIVSGLSAPHAEQLRQQCRDLGWVLTIFDGANEPYEGEEALLAPFAPYRLQLHKPTMAPDTLPLLTLHGFQRALQDGLGASIWLLPSFVGRLDTGLRVIQGWDDPRPPCAAPASMSPRKLVREFSHRRHVPEDVRLWLTPELDEAVCAQPAARLWMSAATAALVVCLPNEIDVDDGSLRFRGPPSVRLAAYQDAAGALDRATFNVLLRAVAWVFANEREAELRHTLLAAELARSGTGQAQSTTEFLASQLAHALESAKIAYQMALSDTARDTLKVLADLKKTVTEETAKLAELSRQLTTSVAGAIATGIGLIAARVIAQAPAVLMISVLLVVMAYIAMIVISGIQFIRLQRRIRSNWQQRLYRFLPSHEYAELVAWPIRQAERTFQATACLGGAAVLMLCATCLWVLFLDRKPPPPLKTPRRAQAQGLPRWC